MARHSKGRSRLPALLGCALCIGVFAVCAVQLARTVRAERQAESAFDALRTAQTVTPADSKESTPTTTGPVQDEQPLVLHDLAALRAQNPDVIGWLSIPDTTLDYPVMQTPDEPDFYLSHGFDRAESPYGVPYADAACTADEPGGNLIVYGHHVKGGAMFGLLDSYTDPVFAAAHPQIVLQTDAGAAVYEIAIVLAATADADDPNVFDYPSYPCFTNAERFDEFLSACRAHALYETGVSLTYGDDLLTLSTCEYTHRDGRLLVVARRAQAAQ